jgi:D-alanine-D-alanine ligase
VLELLEKPFTGAGARGMMLAQDKGLSKKIFQFHQLPYPRFSTIDAGHVEWADDLSFPLIVKPLNEDASIGINSRSVVNNVKELLERIGHLHAELHAPALVEEFIEGREIYVGVLGNGRPEVFPILEWDLSKVKNGPRIASAEAKWDKESEGFHAPQVFPEDLPAELVKRIQETAVNAFSALKLSDYARVDMRLRSRVEGTSKNPDDWEFFIIEMNPNPWLERRSEFAMAARKHGLSYPDLLERILELAIDRHRGAPKPPRKE